MYELRENQKLRPSKIEWINRMKYCYNFSIQILGLDKSVTRIIFILLCFHLYKISLINNIFHHLFAHNFITINFLIVLWAVFQFSLEIWTNFIDDLHFKYLVAYEVPNKTILHVVKIQYKNKAGQFKSLFNENKFLIIVTY